MIKITKDLKHYLYPLFLKGVVTKHLSNSLQWFEFIDIIVKDKNEKAAERDPLFKACSAKMVLKN